MNVQREKGKGDSIVVGIECMIIRIILSNILSLLFVLIFAKMHSKKHMQIQS